MANFYPGVSIKAGIQLENAISFNKQVQLLAEYYISQVLTKSFY